MKTIALALLASTSFGTSAAHGAFPDGAWQLRDYGYVLDVDGDSVRVFDVTAKHCVLNSNADQAQLQAWFGSVQNHSATNITARGGITQYSFSALDKLSDACQQAKPNRDAAANFKVLADTLEQHYAFFAERKIDWPALRAKHEKALDKGGNERKLRAALSEIADVIGDPHLSITNGKSWLSEGKPEVLKRYESQSGSSVIEQLKGLRAALQGKQTPLISPLQSVGKRIVTGRLSADTGYVALASMGGFDPAVSEDAGADKHREVSLAMFDEMLQSVKSDQLKNIVIDLRFNQGGFDSVAIELASRFAAERTLAYRKQIYNSGELSDAQDIWVEPSPRKRFAGDVVVLIGPGTVSAGETAAIALSALPNVTTLGSDHTQGALSDAIPKALPNGWRFTLSMEVASDPSGSSFEVRGVKPDVEETRTAGKWTQASYRAAIDQAVQMLETR
jgi:carboxyl-terminal processing protease